MAQKILVGIPTYAGGEYCRQLLIEYLSKITTDVDVLFVTNSGERDKSALEDATKKLRTCRVIVNDETFSEPYDQVVSNRNVIRKEFLAGDYEYLVFFDHDVIGPLNAIDLLLSHKKKAVSGWYIMGSQHPGEDKPKPRPMVYVFTDESQEFVRQLELEHVLKPQFMKVASTGLGCVLLHRSLLENITFSRLNGTEDAPFYKEVREQGEDLWLDTRVACWHIKHSPGSKDNMLYDPRNYKIKE